MNLSAFAMRYKTVVVTMVLLLSAWGYVTYNSISRREDPEFTIRQCVVFTQWPGTPTTKVEELVTDTLEEALDDIEEVDYLESETINGQSTIYVNLENSVPAGDIQNVWDKVRAKVNQTPMPDSGIHPIVNDEFGDTAVMLLGIYQTPLPGMPAVKDEHRYSPRELEVYADQVRDVLRLLPGVAKVEKYGVQDEVIYIETDLGNWSQLSLTTESLQSLVNRRNIVAPGGSLDTDRGKFNVKPTGEFDAVREIESLTVGTVETDSMNNQVKLSDIGLKVKRDYVDPPQAICRFTDENGTFPAVMLGITMKSGSNIIDVCDAALARVNQLVEIDQNLPRDIAVRPVSNQSDNVSAKIDEVIQNVISAIVIVVAVVFLFLGLRTSLVMAANIPLVVLGAVAMMPLFGVELEQISLASIIIALGLLVDNAVQVCDQTRSNILAGMTPSEAAVKGANVLMLPMLTGTLTTIAAFLPMLIALEGGSAEYVYSLPVTLTTTLLLSWVFAMTICVILAAAFIRAPKDPDKPTAILPWLAYMFGKLIQRVRGGKNESGGGFLKLYELSAGPAIMLRWLTIISAVAILFATLQLPVSSEFFPEDQKDQFYITVSLPETATIADTNQVVHEVETAIKKLSPYKTAAGETVERLRTMRSLTAQTGARWALGVDPLAPGANASEILVRTTSGVWTADYISDLRHALEQGDESLGIQPIAGARVAPKKILLGPPAAAVELRVSGDGFADINQLRRIAGEVENMIREESGTWNINDSWGVDGLQLNVVIDEQKANLAGVSHVAIADTLNAYFSGLELSTFREGDHQIPVQFRLDPDQRKDLSALNSAFVEGANGKVPLNSVASIVPQWEPGKIERRDQNRTIAIGAEVEKGVSGNDVVMRVWNSERMNELKSSLPTGFKVEIGGSLEESQDAAEQMSFSFLMSFIAIILILIFQYNGWSKTIVILFTLPLAVIGAWFGLWQTQNALGFMPQLGLLSLFGIVLNTGIIFIEFADILVKRKQDELRLAGELNGPVFGLTKKEFRRCLVEAGKQRMLPIFLTAATTIAGLLPLATDGGPLWEGMAWLMIYGLIVATILTLYVVPALYAVMVENFKINPLKMMNESSLS